MDRSETLQIEKKSSIEAEPRTLKMDQLQFAREAAIYVSQTKSIEEAVKFFTKGLEPVVKDKKNLTLDSTEDCDNFATQLRLPAAVPVMRDIVSAPF